MAASSNVPTPIVLGVFAVLGVMVLFALGGGHKGAEAVSEATAATARVLDSEEERLGLERAIGDCASRKVSPPDFTEARLYWCVNGREETAKLFINEDPKQPGKVLNVKMMWNEWKAHTPDAGADQRDASRMARVVMKRYAPALEEDVLYAYWGKEAKTFKAEGYRFDYKWTPGPGIDEHLLVVTPEG
jgi:hypothetical protein